MTKLQDLENILNSFENYNVKSFPPLRPNVSDRGLSFDITVTDKAIRFKRKNTPMSIGIDKILKSFCLLESRGEICANDFDFVSIIKDGCSRTFLFQFLKNFNLAKISGEGVKGDVFVATLI